MIRYTYLSRDNVGAHINGALVGIRINGRWTLPVTSEEHAQGLRGICPLLAFGLNNLNLVGLRARS